MVKNYFLNVFLEASFCVAWIVRSKIVWITKKQILYEINPSVIVKILGMKIAYQISSRFLCELPINQA